MLSRVEIQELVRKSSTNIRRSGPYEELTDEEHEAVIASVLRQRDYPPKLTEEDCVPIIQWALDARQNAITLDMVFQQYIDVDCIDGEVYFSLNETCVPHLPPELRTDDLRERIEEANRERRERREAEARKN